MKKYPPGFSDLNTFSITSSSSLICSSTSKAPMQSYSFSNGNFLASSCINSIFGNLNLAYFKPSKYISAPYNF